MIIPIRWEKSVIHLPKIRLIKLAYEKMAFCN